MLGALFECLAEGDDVAIFPGAAPGSYHFSRFVGERSDESDPFANWRKREQRSAVCEFVVLKQDKGLFRRFADQRPVRGNGSRDFHAFRVGVFKKAGCEFYPEHAAHSLIDYIH